MNAQIVDEFDLAIAYQTSLQRVGVLASTLAFAVSVAWASASILSLLLFDLATRLTDKIILPAVIGCCSLPQLFVLWTAAISASIFSIQYFWDDQIQLSCKGILLPKIFGILMHGRNERPWEDVARLSLGNRSGMPLDRQLLTILFRTGGRTCIDLSRLPVDDIEKLLLSLEVWARAAERDPLLCSLQSGLHDLKRGLGLVSYTQLWEEEMNRRFGSTAFVPLQPGMTLQSGKLRVLRQLAFGGLSAIYLAHFDRTEEVVLKESVVLDGASTELLHKAQEMFAREAQLLIKLNHPQIARVRDYFVEGGRHYLLLDYLPGEDLRKIVKLNGPQPERKVLEWGLEIASVLRYLHSQNPSVLHRDISPDNIVLCRGKLTLIDFGAANQLLTTATGTLVGKQSYISPEQFQGYATAASDIYSLGCTLHYLLTGADPEPLSVSHPRAHRQGISNELDSLVAACTDFDESKRIQTAEELQFCIERLLGVGACNANRAVSSLTWQVT